jgi:hypothetical protein
MHHPATPNPEPIEPFLRRWESPDGAAGGWPPVVPGADVWDRDLERLLSQAEDPAFSVLHLLPGGGALDVRRVVHGFSDYATASRYAVENGWCDFTVQPTRSLPSHRRQDAP